MGGAQARRLCPQAIVVSPRMSAYSEASKAVFEVFDDTTPLVEGLSIDEAFLDVARAASTSPGTPPEIAARLRASVRERVGLPITVGVARTKFLAKVASGVAKPDGLLVVPPDGELAFLHPLPVERLWGVGAVTAEKLHDARDRDGRRGRASCPRLRWSRCWAGRRAGSCTRSPTTATRGRWRPAPPALGRRAARARPSAALARRVDATLVALVDRVTRRMRTAGRVGRTVVLRLRFATSRGRRARTRSPGDRPRRSRSSVPRRSLLVPRCR